MSVELQDKIITDTSIINEKFVLECVLFNFIKNSEPFIFENFIWCYSNFAVAYLMKSITLNDLISDQN